MACFFFPTAPITCSRATFSQVQVHACTGLIEALIVLQALSVLVSVKTLCFSDFLVCPIPDFFPQLYALFLKTLCFPLDLYTPTLHIHTEGVYCREYCLMLIM